VILLVAWAPVGLKPLPLTLAILCVALGVVIFSTGLLSFNPDPRTWDTATERLTELVVIISLMGAGLKLDRPLGWRRWSSTWRLLAVANYNHDLGELWEFSDTGYMPVDLSNEAYKFGVNYVIYAMTH